MTIIRFRRGDKQNLPESAPSGMPLWCEDSKELYMGTNEGIIPVIPKINDVSFFGNVPYSVNSGNTDSNGHPDLIQKVSDTEAAFKVGGVYPNMGLTFPNGNHYKISSISNVSGLNDNGVYIFVLMENNITLLEDGTYSAIVTAINKTVIEDIIFPAAADDGDLLLLIDQKPLMPFLRQDDIWVEKQFLKLGQVQKLSGILGTPISYALNGKAVLISNPLATNQRQVLTHNIGSQCFCNSPLVCLTPERNYSIGDEVYSSHITEGGGTNRRALYTTVDKYRIYQQHVNWSLYIPLKTSSSTSSINMSSWAIKHYVRRAF